MAKGAVNRYQTFLLQAGLICGLAGFGCSSGPPAADPKVSEQQKAEDEKRKQEEEQKRISAQKEQAAAAEKRKKEIAELEQKIVTLKEEKAELQKIVDETGKAHRALKAEVWTRNSILKDLQEEYKEAGRRSKPAVKKKVDSAQKTLESIKAKLVTTKDQQAKDEEKLKGVLSNLEVEEKALNELTSLIEKKGSEEKKQE